MLGIVSKKQQPKLVAGLHAQTPCMPPCDATQSQDGQRSALAAAQRMAAVSVSRTDMLTTGHRLNSLLAPAHAEHGALDGLDVQVLLLAGDEVGAHDAHLGTCGHLQAAL